MDWIRYLFSFEGRFNRAKFLLVVLITFGWHFYWAVAGVIVSDVFGLTTNPIAKAILPIPFSFEFEGSNSLWKAAIFALVATIPINIAPLWVAAASWVKRLHDRNKSGWWAIPLCAVPYLYIHFILICAGLNIPIATPILVALLTVPVCLLSAWALIELYFMPGTDGRNRFGADPLSRAATGTSIATGPVAHGVPVFLVQSAAAREARTQS
jgi:uncharacterized membrane protein YhaH (DUF805 family)